MTVSARPCPYVPSTLDFRPHELNQGRAPRSKPSGSVRAPRRAVMVRPLEAHRARGPRCRVLLRLPRSKVPAFHLACFRLQPRPFCGGAAGEGEAAHFCRSALRTFSRFWVLLSSGVLKRQRTARTLEGVVESPPSRPVRGCLAAVVTQYPQPVRSRALSPSGSVEKLRARGRARLCHRRR